MYKKLFVLKYLLLSPYPGPTVLAKGERPKTEDFLTFLCLRGTEHLPPELDFFNQVMQLGARAI